MPFISNKGRAQSLPSLNPLSYANAAVVTVALPDVEDTVSTSTAAVPPVAETVKIISNCLSSLVA
jgi:hypothetical protein